MSQSPSYRRETASASPQSPKEGDFFPRQLNDNLKSLEEHETSEDQKDPVDNITPDDDSSVVLKTQICAPPATNDLGKLCAGTPPKEQLIKKSQWEEPRSFDTSPTKQKPPVSPEFMEVRALDGRFITLVSSQTQTDWKWVEQSLSFSCQVQKEIEDPQLLQAELVSLDTVADSSDVACSWKKREENGSRENTENERMPKREHDIPCVSLPRLIAFRPEPKETPRVEKVPEVECKQNVHLAQCDYCQQPSIHNELLEKETDFEMLFCCEQAKQMRELILEEREKLARWELDEQIDVNPHVPVMSEREREAAKIQAKERLQNLQLQMHSTEDNTDKDFRDLPYNKDEPQILQIDIKNITGMFTLRGETDGDTKKAIKKFYKSGRCFLTLCPDGTGNVFYPSGKAAIIISSAEAADFTYIILEDKDVEPNIKGIFTSKGHSTCYHPNGMIWLNLTPLGGLCFSETGALKRRWNWLYFDPHARNLPFKPLTFSLDPHISVRIRSQDRMYVTFVHQQNSVRFSLGSTLKPIHPESPDKPGHDFLERHIQMKSSEIYSLLGQMQNCMSQHSANLNNIKQRHSFIARCSDPADK